MQAPSLLLMLAFCRDLDAFLGQNPDNFAAVHCKVIFDPAIPSSQLPALSNYSCVVAVGLYQCCFSVCSVSCHAQAGKGRTGVMICGYFLYKGLVANAEEALQVYAHQRTTDGSGVTVPSQSR